MTTTNRKTKSLYVHCREGCVWYADTEGARPASKASMPESEFVSSPLLQTVDQVKLAGSRSNASLILDLFRLQQRAQLDRVIVVPPRIITLPCFRSR